MLVGLCIIINLKYIDLQREFSEYKNFCLSENKEFVTENVILKHEIGILNDSLVCYQKKIDSLNLIKQKIIVLDSFCKSETITEGVKILKNNLSCEK